LPKLWEPCLTGIVCVCLGCCTAGPGKHVVSMWHGRRSDAHHSTCIGQLSGGCCHALHACQSLCS